MEVCEEVACECGAMAFIEKRAIKMPERTLILYEIKCPKCNKKVMATHKNLAVRNWEK